MADIVDELIVRLTLDTEEYSRAERRIGRDTDRTFRQQQERARRTDRTNRDQMRRLKDMGAGVRSFGVQVAAATGLITGMGVAVGGILTGFLGFQTQLSRQTVSTGLSNRQMQAWSATARRMGADAEAGGQAIAALAKEQKQFNLTGSGPTMQALASFGVNVNPGRNIADILADAQGAYRNAAPGQQMQMEATLAAQGVSDDLILMIKSEIGVREAYSRSLEQATAANDEAMAKLRDGLESLKAQAIGAAGALLTALEPAIKVGAEKLGELTTKVVKFANDLTDAGISVDGFQGALDKNFPVLGHLFEGFGLLGDLVSDLVPAFQNLLGWLKDKGGRVREVVNRVRNPFGTGGLADGIESLGGGARPDDGGLTLGNRAALALSDWWGRVTARPSAPPRNIEPELLARSTGTAAATPANAQGIMATLTSQYGLTVSQAAAVVANWQAESSLNPGAVNPTGGGTGARGLAQWRGARTQAFRQRYGKMPNEATVAQQIEFAMTDPYERGLMQRAWASAGGGGASALGTAFSRVYEAHGNVAEDNRRGRLAAQYAGAPAAGAGATSTSVNIQNMTVQTNNPGEFAQGLQRIDSTQPYNSVVR